MIQKQFDKKWKRKTFDVVDEGGKRQWDFLHQGEEVINEGYGIYLYTNVLFVSEPSFSQELPDWSQLWASVIIDYDEILRFKSYKPAEPVVNIGLEVSYEEDTPEPPENLDYIPIMGMTELMQYL
jgi:hypothetical protein